MGQQHSIDELLYQQVSYGYGNVQGIITLYRDGANLEWVDRDGKTPLIVACLNPDLFNFAKTLIELGANVNAYCPGQHNGTPLHHAAKRGLNNTVKLLLANGANALLVNDDCQTPLEIARTNGYSDVVRTIENDKGLFSGWMRQFFGPGFLTALAPTLLSKIVWIVVMPCGSRNRTRPFNLELAVYSSLQDPQPKLILPLWKTHTGEPNFHRADSAVVITHMSSKIRVTLGPEKVGDKLQLEVFCYACEGIPQVMHSAISSNVQTHVVSAPPVPLDYDVYIPINTHMQSTALPSTSTDTRSSSSVPSDHSVYHDAPSRSRCDDRVAHDAGPSNVSAEQIQNENNSVVHPSAPPLPNEYIDTGLVHYPSIDSIPENLSISGNQTVLAEASEKKQKQESSCVICFDGPIEGACIPCGHMAGCMMCLNEIKLKNWGCPLCRAKIDQVVRIYAA